MILPVAVIFSNTQWTFWNVFLLFFLWIPLIMLWFFAIFDVFRRPDLSGGGKVLWLLAILILPWIGTLLYLILRPAQAGDYAGGYGGYGANYGYMGYGRYARTTPYDTIGQEEYAAVPGRPPGSDPAP